jgi:hypothetical protein
VHARCPSLATTDGRGCVNTPLPRPASDV